MKNATSKMIGLFAFGLVVLSAAIPANAQVSTMRVQVPFAFLAGAEKLPAGDYEFRVNADFRFVDIRSMKESVPHRVALTGGLMPGKEAPAEAGYASFYKNGQDYSLRGLWRTGAPVGYLAAPSKAEKEMARSGGAVTTTNIQTVR